MFERSELAALIFCVWLFVLLLQIRNRKPGWYLVPAFSGQLQLQLKILCYAHNDSRDRAQNDIMGKCEVKPKKIY